MLERGVFKDLYKCINGHFRYVYALNEVERESGATIVCHDCPETMSKIPAGKLEFYNFDGL